MLTTNLSIPMTKTSKDLKGNQFTAENGMRITICKKNSKKPLTEKKKSD